MSYTVDDIQTLDLREAVRTRVGMYMGSADNQGVLQCVKEIVTNSVDEATMGFGKKIIVEIFKDNLVKITDEGRGCPFGKRADGTEALVAIFTTAHSGAKFNTKVFQNVGGTNGTGSKGTALSSDYFKAESYRSGQCATLILDKGVQTSYEVINIADKKKSGTIVSFIPSPEVYNLEKIKLDDNEIKALCKQWSYLFKDITFVFENHVTSEKVRYHSKNGLTDMIKELAKEPIHSRIMHYEIKEDDFEAEIAMQWTRGREKSVVITNGLEQIEGGTSLTGTKTAITTFMKKFFTDNFSGEIARTGLVYVISCKAAIPSFANQTKTKINNPELRGLCQRATGKMLKDFQNKDNAGFTKVVDFLTKEKKAEQAAQRARNKVLGFSKDIEKNQKKKVMSTDKLKDAEFLGENSTLLIVEGDSAQGGVAMARDTSKYGILTIKGKILNCLSNTEEKIYDNEEIKLLMSAMNIVPGKYNNKKLRYGKIAICVDADRC